MNLSTTLKMIKINQYFFVVFILVVYSLLTMPVGQPVKLRVVGYQNKSHIIRYKGNQQFSVPRENEPVERETVIQVPEYTYREDNQPECLFGLKRDGNGKCRDIW